MTLSSSRRTALRERVWRASDGCCELCGVELTFGAFDLGHRVAQIDGGGHELENLRVECRSCNRSAGARMSNSRRWTPHIVTDDDSQLVAVESDWSPPLLTLGATTPGDDADLTAAESALNIDDSWSWSRRELVRPLYSTPLDLSASSRLVEIAALAEEMKIELLPWQRFAVRAGTELDERGLPRHRTVGISVGRQQGKTLLLSVLVLDALLRGADEDRHAVVYWIGANFSETIGIWSDKLLPSWKRAGVEYEFKRTGRVEVKDCGVVHIRGGQGRLPAVGGTADLVVLDECWSLSPDVEAAAIPVTRTVAHAQHWLVSSYAPETTGWWLDRTASGRAAAEIARHEQRSADWCYMEWGAALDSDVHDESSWKLALPAVDDPTAGVTLDVMRSEHASVAESTWTHALLNRRPPVGGSPAISPVDWSQCLVTEQIDDPLEWIAAAGGASLGIDAPPVLSASTPQIAMIVAVAGERACLLRSREGVSWIPTAVEEIAEQIEIVEVCCLAPGRRGAVAPVFSEIDCAPVDLVDSQGYADACVSLHERIRAHELRIYDPSRVLTNAAYAAVGISQTTSSGWGYGRAKADGQFVTAIYALALAHQSASLTTGVRAFLVNPAVAV